MPPTIRGHRADQERLNCWNKETAVEILEPFQKGCSVIFTGKGFFCKEENLCRMIAEADNLIKEEIVQLIGADQILGFLVDFPVFIRRQQLGADRGIQYIQQSRRMPLRLPRRLLRPILPEHAPVF